MKQNYRALSVGIFLFFASTLLASRNSASETIFVAKYYEENGKTQLIYFQEIAGMKAALRNEIHEERYPAVVSEHEQASQKMVVEIYGRSRRIVEDELGRRSVKIVRIAQDPNAKDEVIPLVENGPSSNRIDLVFMGDGYTESERGKFIEDMKRLTEDLFSQKTFNSYLPLFNVYAVFRASNESGIGKQNVAKDTAYGLYRDGNTLRAIFASYPQKARESCGKAPGCDYPIIVANDPYYGGLGGEFAITTSSPTSGTIVLRHELGHNFGRVGEEYDGGGYFGANVSSSLSSLKWNHWLSGSVKAEPAVARFLDWPWHSLSQGPYKVRFNSDGKWSHHQVEFSGSGLETADSLRIELDGKRIPFDGMGHGDRVFYTLLEEPVGFIGGNHELSFSEQVSDGNNWISSVNIYEYGDGYHFEGAYIGAYPLFEKDGSLQGYRSNHERCLMRNMRSDMFCSICQENQWHHFLRKVSLIDGVQVSKGADSVSVNLNIQGLGQFGKESSDDKIAIRWFKKQQLVQELNNMATWQLPLSEATGNWEVKVEFITPEVRKDSENLLKDKESFKI